MEWLLLAVFRYSRTFVSDYLLWRRQRQRCPEGSSETRHVTWCWRRQLIGEMTHCTYLRITYLLGDYILYFLFSLLCCCLEDTNAECTVGSIMILILHEVYVGEIISSSRSPSSSRLERVLLHADIAASPMLILKADRRRISTRQSAQLVKKAKK